VHHAARIMSAGHGGQILLSQTTRELAEQHLPAGTSLLDLGEHRLKDLQRPSHLFQLSLAELPTEFPPLKTLGSHPNNLPIQPTAFIGREQVVGRLCELVQRPEVRLLTLTGPGGVGKTRLSLQVAAELSELFADGVYAVMLAPVSDPAWVVPAIAQTLSISEVSNQPLLPLMQSALKEKQLLLLLDNFEQVTDAALQVAELLAACPKLKVLVTSRVVLHVRAEREFAVPPLSVPNPKRLPDLLTLSQYEAVELFSARAQLVKSDFAVTNANAPAVASICARLDGLPLAIELAAARVKYFSPQNLLARLEQGLSVLVGGARDLPARQQTLRGAIAWSYDLLAPEEQALFRRLAVFVDGCTLEAAEAACTAAGALEGDLLEGLASLLDKSLLRQEEQAEGEARFWMLQTLREFGLERLAEAEETEATRQAHALYYLALAEEAEPHLRGAEQTGWLARLEQEQENLRVALTWLLDGARLEEGTQQAEYALRLCAALHWFWYIRGYLREGRTFLERALAQGEDAAAPVRARALSAAGELALVVDDIPRAEALWEQGLELFRELRDTAGMATTLLALGFAAFLRNQFAAARARLEEAEALFQQVEDSWSRGRCLSSLSRVYIAQGEYDRALSLLEESLALYRALNDKARVGWVLYLLAQALFLSQLDLATASVLAEESLAHVREVGDKWVSALALSLLGEIVLQRGDALRARALIEESITILKEVEDRVSTAETLTSLARVATCQGETEMASGLYKQSLAILQGYKYGLQEFANRDSIVPCLEGLGAVLAGQEKAAKAVEAARLWGAAEALREAIGAPLPPVYRAGYERAVAAARAQLGEGAFATAWDEGQTMPLDQVFDEVLKPHQTP
jgi:predicted ATPase